MKKHVRTITIVAVALLLPVLLILPITQAKRAKKSPSKPALTQPNDPKNATYLPRSLITAQDDKGGPTPIVSNAVRFAATIPLRDMEVPTFTTSRKFGQVETNTETPEKTTRRSAMVEGDYDATLGESARSAPETQPDLLQHMKIYQ